MFIYKIWSLCVCYIGKKFYKTVLEVRIELFIISDEKNNKKVLRVLYHFLQLKCEAGL
jgi:hypothetical protein